MRSQNAIVRSRTEKDLLGAAAALIAVHAADGYPVEGVDQPEAWLTPPGLLHAWVAEVAEKVVGHVAITAPRGEDAVDLYLEQTQRSIDQLAVMARLFVAPEARGRSLGEHLVRAATSYARSQGLTLVGDVMAKDEAAIRLYERLGCRFIGMTVHRHGDGEETPAVCFAAPEG